MTKEEILKHPAWEALNRSTLTQRDHLINLNKKEFEKVFDVRIEKWPFTRINEIRENTVYLSVGDGTTNSIAVFIPNPIKDGTQ